MEPKSDKKFLSSSDPHSKLLGLGSSSGSSSSPSPMNHRGTLRRVDSLSTIPRKICNSSGWNLLPEDFSSAYKLELSKICNTEKFEFFPDVEEIIDGEYRPLKISLKGSKDIKKSNDSKTTKLRISFSGWLPLRPEDEQMAALDNEKKRERAKDLVVKALDALVKLGIELLGIKFIIAELDVSHTEASMRCIFGGTMADGKSYKREKEVEVMNLSFTRTSSRSIASLFMLVNLKRLYLDNCSSIKKAKNVFASLMEHGKVESLEVISLVGTSDALSHDWMTHMDQKCPKLRTVYFTRKPGDKSLGWTDAVMLQTMNEPVRLPCGHIADFTSLSSFAQKKCSICRTPFYASSIVRVNPRITKLEKQDATQWHAQVCDTLRNKLDDGKVLYHAICGEFFNHASVSALYKHHLAPLKVSQDNLQEAIPKLEGKYCNGCLRMFEKSSLLMCFVNSEETDVEFQSLTQASEYSSVKYVPPWDEPDEI